MEKNSISPVFIIGCSRTGSTLLQNLLNQYSDIDILPEVQLIVPKWIHKDFEKKMKPLKRLEKDEYIDKLIDLMYSKKLFGVFWEKIRQREIDQSYLKSLLMQCGRETEDILYAIMKAHAYSKKKNTLGAKFPVYICYANKLTKWFEKSRIIHTVRDPRGIFASQYYKRRVNKGSWIKKSKVAFLQFIHINIQYYWAARTHKYMKKDLNYFCCKYEDLVQQPEQTIRNLCDFLNIKFDPNMLEPKVILNTSFKAERKVSGSFKTSSVYAWKNRIPRLVSFFIEKLQKFSMKEFGY